MRAFLDRAAARSGRAQRAHILAPLRVAMPSAAHTGRAAAPRVYRDAARGHLRSRAPTPAPAGSARARAPRARSAAFARVLAKHPDPVFGRGVPFVRVVRLSPKRSPRRGAPRARAKNFGGFLGTLQRLAYAITCTMAPHEQPCLLPRAVYLSALAPRGQAGIGMPFAAAAAMEPGGSGMTNLLLGPLLQCMEAATLGMPLEARACGGASPRGQRFSCSCAFCRTRCA
jgi:hypothetical protein